jgi:hypothetical protein
LATEGSSECVAAAVAPSATPRRKRTPSSARAATETKSVQKGMAPVLTASVTCSEWSLFYGRPRATSGSAKATNDSRTVSRSANGKVRRTASMPMVADPAAEIAQKRKGQGTQSATPQANSSIAVTAEVVGPVAELPRSRRSAASVPLVTTKGCMSWRAAQSGRPALRSTLATMSRSDAP